MHCAHLLAPHLRHLTLLITMNVIITIIHLIFISGTSPSSGASHTLYSHTGGQ